MRTLFYMLSCHEKCTSHRISEMEEMLGENVKESDISLKFSVQKRTLSTVV